GSDSRDSLHVRRDVDLERTRRALRRGGSGVHAGADREPHDDRPRDGARHAHAERSGVASTSCQICAVRVSRNANVPTPKVSRATPMGSQSPASGLPVPATIEVAISGVNPPNQPFAKWYGSESDV